MQKISNFLSQIENDSLDKLGQLVAINSYTRNRHGVNQVGKLCAEFFETLDFIAEFKAPSSSLYGDHLFLTRPGTSQHSIMLVSHLDTVYLEEEEKLHKFYFRKEGKKIYGPGVCDIKGGTIVMFMVLNALRECDREMFDKINWCVFLNACEEEGAAELPDLIYPYIDRNTLAALVYEAGKPIVSGSTIVHARKGSARFEIETFGRQAHSGTNHKKGVNALLQLAYLISEIEEATDYTRELTFTIGKAQGGVVSNRIPDYANCLVDIRAKTTYDYNEAIDKIKEMEGVGRVKSFSDGFCSQIKVRQLAGYPPWPHNDASEKLAKIATDCGRELGMSITPEYRFGSSDGCFLWDQVATIDGLGPIGQDDHCSIHKPEQGKYQESALTSSFIEKAMLNIAIMQKLASNKI